MSDPISQPEYMLLFRGSMLDRGLSPQALQDVMTRWKAWYDGLVSDGRAVSGRPLGAEGRVVTGRGGRHVADGPFAESKEAVGGYFMLHVADFDEAVEIARHCPGLDYGLAVEVRQVRERCVALEAAEKGEREQLATTTA
jgi:hypothetical protein